MGHFAWNVFDDQCDDLIHAYILASVSSCLFPSDKLMLCVPSSSSLELKPFSLILSNMLSWAIIANDLNSTQAALVFYLLVENKDTLGGP